MTEVQAAQSLPQGFTTVTYVTKDGEKCTATKNNGIVTVQGDKNGVRQVPLDDFIKELAVTLPKVDLEKTPQKDTVNFSGREDSDEDKSLRNKYLKIGAGVVAALGAATTLFFIGKGKWWMKGAKNIETKGSELVDDITGGLNKAGEKAEQTAEQAVEHSAAPKVDPEIKIEPKVEPEPVIKTETPTEQPKPETPKTETAAPKAEETVQPEKTVAAKEESNIVYEGKHGVKSPFMPDEIIELPKVLETDVKKLITEHEVYQNPFGQNIVKIENVEGKYDRMYFLNNDKSEIDYILDTARKEMSPFRRIDFKDGEPVSIRDLTYAEGCDHVNFLKKSGKQKKPYQNPSMEIKDNPVNDDALIAAAAIDHAAATEAKTIAEGEKAAEELFSSTPGKNAAEEIFGTKPADELLAQTPHSDAIHTPTIDELYPETNFSKGYDELDEIRLGDNDEYLHHMTTHSSLDPNADPLNSIDGFSHMEDDFGGSSFLDDFAG